MAEWIPVTDRLPEIDRQIEGGDFLVDYSAWVLICSPTRACDKIEIGSFANEGMDCYWMDRCFRKIKGVTHWMPLPELPEKG